MLGQKDKNATTRLASAARLPAIRAAEGGFREKHLALKIVIQCAGRKNDWSYFRADDGTRLEFVARPGNAPQTRGIRYAHPDDASDNGLTWRQRVSDFNRSKGTSPSSLEPAYRLYRARQYEQLVDEFGASQIFVLSAGWGLVRSDFLLPHYNITFQKPANRAEWYIWRRRRDRFDDFHQLAASAGDHVIFIGGSNYRYYFETFCADLNGMKTVYYNSDTISPHASCQYKRFETKRKQNWHYSCADELIELHRRHAMQGYR